MLVIKIDSFCVIVDSLFVLALLPVSETSVVVEICLGWLKVDSSGEGLYSGFEISFAVQTDALVIICVRILRFNLSCEGVVSNGLLEFAKFVIREASVEEGLEVSRLNFDCLGVKINCLLVITSFPCGVA